VLAIGAVLLVAAMALGVFGLVRRGYELIVTMTMLVLLLLGFVALAKGLIG
jgi:hypothetical protein